MKREGGSSVVGAKRRRPTGTFDVERRRALDVLDAEIGRNAGVVGGF